MGGNAISRQAGTVMLHRGVLTGLFACVLACLIVVQSSTNAEARTYDEVKAEVNAVLKDPNCRSKEFIDGLIKEVNQIVYTMRHGILPDVLFRSRSKHSIPNPATAVAGDDVILTRLAAHLPEKICPPLPPPEPVKRYFIGEPPGRYKRQDEERQEIGLRNRPNGGPRTELASWTGPFIGAQAAGSFSTLTTSEYFAATGVRTNQFDDTGSGFGGGVNFGWNWQPWNPSIVVGVVFDVNGLNDKVRHDFAGGSYIGATVNFTASAQVRGGVLVTPNFLLYGQGGLSVANQQLQIDFGGPETNESKIVPGSNLGFGGEWKLPTNPLPFGRSMSLFADYSHTWWDTARLDMPVASPFFNYTWQRETDAVKFGARINWGDGPPR
ncbi:MAG TPA: hypothetical protein VN065_15135 [Bradyrhizobium sp.]|nr:hypothetical protein [Bradyrhizobium sp.]